MNATLFPLTAAPPACEPAPLSWLQSVVVVCPISVWTSEYQEAFPTKISYIAVRELEWGTGRGNGREGRRRWRWAYDENVRQWLWQEQHTDTAHRCFNNISIDHQNTIKSWFHSREEKWTASRFIRRRCWSVFVCDWTVCVHSEKHVCAFRSVLRVRLCVCVYACEES